jgi:tetratricopeptide (TPR) repeat protein
VERCYQTAIVILLMMTMPLTEAVAATTAPSAGYAATIKIGKGRERVILLGCKDGRVLYRQPDAPPQAMAAFALKDISGAKIKLPYDRQGISKALSKGNWQAAATTLFRAVRPAVSLLQIRNNDLVPLALRSGTYLMRAGSLKAQGGWTKPARERAASEYKAAYAMLMNVSACTWSSRAPKAKLNAVICLVMMDRIEEAERLLDTVPEHTRDDDSYGLYHLAKAYVQLAKEDPHAAMASAVESVAYETKDLDTFPAALLISAKCYEDLGNWHRARDVYYEVGRLFKKTVWATQAIRRLKFIVAEGHTAQDEQARINKVFFGVEEDMNAKVAEFLGGKKPNADQAQKKEKKKK